MTEKARDRPWFKKKRKNDRAVRTYADPPYTQASDESDQGLRLCSLRDEIRSFAISAENQGQFCLQDHDHAFWKALWFWCASLGVEVSVLLSEACLKVKAAWSGMKLPCLFGRLAIAVR